MFQRIFFALHRMKLNKENVNTIRTFYKYMNSMHKHLKKIVKNGILIDVNGYAQRDWVSE